MNPSVLKDFRRELGKSLGRFLSIFCIVLVGVAFFAGIKATVPDMQYTADSFYDESQLYDIRVMSPLGLTKEDIQAIRESEDVSSVEAGYFTDTVSRIDGTEIVFRVHSLPQEMNQLQITSGRLPEKGGECVVEDGKSVTLKVALGDKIKLSSGSSQKKLEDSLKRDEFTVVGTVRSADYLTYEKGHTDLGSGSINFFMMVPAVDFSYPVYVEALIEVEGAREMNSFSKAYDQQVMRVLNTIENLGGERATIRAEELKKEANKELDKARQELADKEKEFDEKIGQAETELKEANDKLVAGEATLETEKKNFEKTYEDGWAQVAQGERDLANAQAQYDQSLSAYNSAMAQHGDQIARLDQLAGDVNGVYGDAIVGRDQMVNELNNPNLTPEERATRQQMLDQYSSLINVIERADQEVGGLNSLAQSSVNNAENQLASAAQNLANGRAQLEEAKGKLNAAKAEADQKFVAARLELDEGWEEYREAEAKFRKEKEEGEQKLREGRERIIRAEQEIERLSAPKWYVLDRESNIGLMSYKLTTQRMNAIAGLFPLFFILVAALVCLTTMTRMVDEQRGFIGVYKALGYGNDIISFKFTAYAAMASFSGAVLGIVLGMSFFPQAIFQAWSMMYTIPCFRTIAQWPLVILSILFATVVMAGVAWMACKRELESTPATLLRPRPPASGGRILLERAKSLWAQFSFMQKVTARNIFRYKKRFWMTVAGITGCAALLLAGFGMNNSVSQVVHMQFEEIFRYQMAVQLSPEGDVKGEARYVEGVLERDPQVINYQRVANLNVEVDHVRELVPVSLVVPEHVEGLPEFIELRHRGSKEAIDLSRPGVVITEKLARLLEVGVGDYITLISEGLTKKVEVSAITEHYVFHYAYMNPEYYREIFRLEPEYSGFQVRLTPEADEEALGSKILERPGVGSVLFFSKLAENFSEQVASLQSIVLLIILSAGVLAFVVLYNLSNININERIREIATLKVLGFYDREVSSYVYREIMILAFIGTLIGLASGVGLHRMVMNSIEQDNIMFGYHISPLSFLFAFVLTMVFTIFVNLVMYRYLRDIPMVESLKSVE